LPEQHQFGTHRSGGDGGEGPAAAPAWPAAGLAAGPCCPRPWRAL